MTISSNGRGYVPSGVIRSHFPRRPYGFGRARQFPRKPYKSIILPRGRGRFNRPSLVQADMKFDQETSSFETKTIIDGGTIDDEPSVSGLQVSQPSVMMNGSSSKKKANYRKPFTTSIVAGIREDINLLSVINNTVGPSGTAKDLVTLENFKKFSVEKQQYLLRLLPRGDVIEKEDGTLEPTFSAFKNEYISADLLSFTERLRVGELAPLGFIAPLPQKSPSPIRSPVPSGRKIASPSLSRASPSKTGFDFPQSSTPNMTPSSSPQPPLPKLRINVLSKQVTFIHPKEGQQNGWSEMAAYTDNMPISNGEDGASNGSSSTIDEPTSSATVTRETSVTNDFHYNRGIVPTAGLSPNSYNEESDSDSPTESSWSENTEFQSMRGCPPQKAGAKRKR